MKAKREPRAAQETGQQLGLGSAVAGKSSRAEEPPAERPTVSPAGFPGRCAQSAASSPRRGEDGEQAPEAPAEPPAGLRRSSTRPGSPGRAVERLGRRCRVTKDGASIRSDRRVAEGVQELAERRAAGPLGKSRVTPATLKKARSAGGALIVPHLSADHAGFWGAVWQSQGGEDGTGLPRWAWERRQAMLRACHARSARTEPESLRARVWSARDAGRTIAPLARCGGCGWSQIGAVGIARRSDGRFALASVATCGSVWACPVCCLVIKGTRAEEIKRGVELHRQHFGAESLAMLTMTIRHASSHDLASLIEGYQRSWNRFFQTMPEADKARRKLARVAKIPQPEPLLERLGFLGGVHGAETTHGRNGWHYHRHQVAAFERNISEAERQELEREGFEHWRACVVREMGPEHEPSSDHGFKVTRLNVADYIAKLGLEVADVGTKKARNGNTSPWGLMLEAAAGNGEALASWGEYCRATLGKKAVQFSERLIEKWQALGWRAPVDESELVDESQGAALVLELVPDEWRMLRVSGQSFALLAAAESDGIGAAMAMLRDLCPDPDRSEDWGAGKRAADLEDARLEAAERYRHMVEAGAKRESRADKRARLAQERQALEAATCNDS